MYCYYRNNLEIILIMKIFIVLLATCFLFSHAANAETRYSLGLGLGVLTSGLGVNISRINDSEMTYVSGGCVSKSQVGGSACGIGMGWLTTKFIKPKSNSHVVGGYVGVVSSEVVSKNHKAINEPIYGARIVYSYFFNTISKPGTVMGVSTIVIDDKDGFDGALGYTFNIGYQF